LHLLQPKYSYGHEADEAGCVTAWQKEKTRWFACERKPAINGLGQRQEAEAL
jgi:hypothetical protein